MRERKLGRDIEKREIEIDIERYSEIERGQTEKLSERGSEIDSGRHSEVDSGRTKREGE